MQCIYHLDIYTFDTQVRLIYIYISYVLFLPGMPHRNALKRSFAREPVELVPGILKMSQPTPPLFRITHWNLLHSDNLEGGMQVVVVMKRKIMS